MKVKNHKIEVLQNQLRTMYELQDNTNSIVNSKWKDANNNWLSAILVESGELIDSLAYKWWKKQEVDIENAKTELVDIWHFVMSLQLQNDLELTDEYLNSLASNLIIFDQSNPGSFNKDSVIDKVLEMNHVAFCYSNSIKLDQEYLECHNVTESIYELVNELDMTSDEFYNRYMIKNALNNVRSKRGYKEGIYIKTWFINHNHGVVEKIEDNQVALDIMNVIDTSSFTKIEDYEDVLLNHYDNNVVPNKDQLGV